jgi:hypothetical protein
VAADEQALGHADPHCCVEGECGVFVGFEDLGGDLGADLVVVDYGAQPM